MKKITQISIAIIALIVFLILLSIATVAHPGRLDSNGGHRKTSDGTYHYHTGSDRSTESVTKPGTSSGNSSEGNGIGTVQTPKPTPTSEMTPTPTPEETVEPSPQLKLESTVESMAESTPTYSTNVSETEMVQATTKLGAEEIFGIVLFSIIFIGSIIFLIVYINQSEARRKKIYSIIKSSDIRSIQEISSICQLEYQTTERELQKLINTANTERRSGPHALLKNAYIDSNQKTVVLASNNKKPFAFWSFMKRKL